MESHLCQFCEKVSLNGFLDCGHNEHNTCLETFKNCVYCESTIKSNDKSNFGPVEKSRKTKLRKMEELVHCSICIECIPKKGKVFCYPCGHVFHNKCATKWNNVIDSIVCPNKCPK
jgi:hypothetical protein